MKNFLTILFCLFAVEYLQASSLTPLFDAFLQSNLNGNGQKITNVVIMAAGSNVALSTNAAGLVVVTATGGSGTFSPDASQIAVAGNGIASIIPGAFQTNFNGVGAGTNSGTFNIVNPSGNTATLNIAGLTSGGQNSQLQSTPAGLTVNGTQLASGGFVTANGFTGPLTGNASSATSFSGSLTGDVTGTQGATVVGTVDGSTAANVHAAELAANAATSANTASEIVARDSSGNFSAGTITANLTGNASGSAGSMVSTNVSFIGLTGRSGITQLTPGGLMMSGKVPIIFTDAFSSGADTGLYLIGYNSAGSGIGLNFCSVGTNALNPANGFSAPHYKFSVNGDGSTNYGYDELASSFIQVAWNAPHGDLPGRTLWIQNPYDDFSIAAAFSDGSGNRSYMQSEQTKGLLHFSYWANGVANNLPQDGGYYDAAVLDLYNGLLAVTNTIVTSNLTIRGIASGNGSGLTSLPAGQLTGSLPAISGASLTAVPPSVVLSNWASSNIYIPINITNATAVAGVNINTNGNINSTGTISANSFAGIGTLLTALSASAISSGTIGASYLPVATASTVGAVSYDNNTIGSDGGILSVIGVPAGFLIGTVGLANSTTNFGPASAMSLDVTNGNITGHGTTVFTGNGGGLTNLQNSILIADTNIIVSPFIPMASASGNPTPPSGTAIFTYIGKTALPMLVNHVYAATFIAGTGAQTAEIGIFSTTSAPAGASLSISPLAVGNLSAVVNQTYASNTSAFNYTVPAGTFLWVGMRQAMATTQSSFSGVTTAAMYGGVVQVTSSSGALTGTGPWTGALPPLTASSTVPELFITTY